MNLEEQINSRLQSGIGFAPQFDSEEGGPDSRAEQFFDNAWRTGKFQECVNIGFPEKIALSAFRKINGNAGIKPQYADSSTPEGKEFYNGVLSECRDLLRMISKSIGDTDPGLFNYRIENALRRGEDGRSCPTGTKKMQPPLTFGRVLSRLGKVQTSLPLLSLLQNLHGCKKSRILPFRARAGCASA